MAEVGLEDVAHEPPEDHGRRIGVVGGRVAGHVVADEHQLAHAAEESVDEGCQLALGVAFCHAPMRGGGEGIRPRLLADQDLRLDGVGQLALGRDRVLAGLGDLGGADESAAPAAASVER